MKKPVLFLLCVLSLQTASGFQQETFLHLTTENGLSQNLVFDLVQDDEGFIWIGTKDGLNRFDGYNFKTYRSEATNKGSLSSNYITFVEVDAGGNLWVQSQPGGLHLYDPYEDSFLKINTVTSAPEIFRSSFVNAISGNNENGWWIATTKGLFFLDPDLKQVIEKHIPGIPDHTSVNAIHKYPDKPGVIIAVGDQGIYKVRSDTAEIQPFGGFNQHLRDKQINQIVKTDSGNWLFLENSAIHTFAENGEFLFSRRHHPSEGERFFNISELVQLQSGRILFLRGRTVYEYSEQEGNFQVVWKDKFINTILEDHSGILWFGTSGYGIYKYDPKLARFGFTSENYYEVLVPDIHKRIEDATAEQTTVFERQIFGIEQFSEDRLFILTRTAGLYEYNSTNGSIKRYSIKTIQGDITRREMLDMDLTQDGEIVIFGYAGVVIFNPDTYDRDYIPLDVLFPEFTLDTNLPIFEKLTFVRKIGSVLWLGSIEYGLTSYNMETGRRYTYRHDPDDTLSISSDHVLHLSQDPNYPDRYVWAGTDGGGINRIDLSSKQVMRFTETNGLPNNVIYAVYPDSSGFLWMTSNKGIIRMDTETFHFLNFTTTDGLQSNEFNRREHIRLADGRFVFCGVFGCNIFNPYDIQLNSSKPKMVITDISVKNKSVLPLSSGWFSKTAETPVLETDWRQNILTVQFAALEFSGPDKNQYKYRIPPFLNEWSEIGNRREITVTNLDPGYYQLEILGSNNDGIWSDVPATLGVNISPPFWMTTIFRVIVILILTGLIISLVWYLSRRKYRQKVRELEYKMAVDRERLRISRDMHDDLGSRLTQISMLSEFALGSEENMDKVRRTFQEISHESKEIIQQFSEIVWSLNPKNDTLNNLADFMVSYTENFCRNTGLPCRIDADTSFPEIQIASGERHHLLYALKEALNNAAKYSRASEIRLKLHVSGSSLKISVSDNGCGFDPKTLRSTGQGLTNMKKRMQEIGGECIIDTRKEQGTTIIFTWPLYHTKG